MLTIFLQYYNAVGVTAVLFVQVFDQVLAVSDMSGVPEEHDVWGEVQTLSVS